MNYSDEEKKIIINHTNRVTNQIEKEKEIDADIKDYEKRIKILKRKKAACKGQQTKSKNLINNIVCRKFIQECPDDIIGMIIIKLYNTTYFDNTKSIINKLYKVSKKFRIIINELFNFIKITLYKNQQILLIPFQSNLGKKFNFKILEQLLYIPFTKNTRSLIHLFVRNNKLNIMKNLVSEFPNLNINVPTTIDGWLPIHNALWFNNNLIDFLINLGIKDDWNFQNRQLAKFDDIYHYIGWLKIYKKYYSDESSFNLEDFKKSVKDNKHKIDLQTEIDYAYLINCEQNIVDLISQIYEYLNDNIKNIYSFEFY